MPLKKSEIKNLLESNDDKLFQSADEIREKYKGNCVHIRGLIEFTNICRCNCFYCGLRRDNKELERYRLSEEEILNCVQRAVNAGYKTVVLQGGEDMFFDSGKLCSLIKKIKKYDIAVTLSIGERSYDEYKDFKTAGADRYLLRIETTDKNLYAKLHPNMSFDNRIKCLYNLKKLGYETGTGIIAGLKGQSIDSIAEDILFFKELNADMVGIGPFIAHPNTPLAGDIKDNFDLSLRTMAITRLMLPDINIPATTAMETIRLNGRLIALNSGANVVMINMTTAPYRKKYEIYPNKSCINDSPEHCVNCIKSKIESIGRKVSNSKGSRYEN